MMYRFLQPLLHRPLRLRLGVLRVQYQPLSGHQEKKTRMERVQTEWTDGWTDGGMDGWSTFQGAVGIQGSQMNFQMKVGMINCRGETE